MNDTKLTKALKAHIVELEAQLANALQQLSRATNERAMFGPHWGGKIEILRAEITALKAMVEK